MMESAARTQGDVMEELIVEARRDSAEFPVVLANHLPMMMLALRRLGASDERLRDYFATYRASSGLVPMPPEVAPIIRERWTEALGDRSRETDYRIFFEAEVRRLGIEGALAAYLPTLVPGIAASAMHALMRLSYGLMRMDPAEVGTALGYWAATYLALPLSTGAPPITDDPGEVLARVGAMAPLRDVVPESDLVWHNIKAASSAPCFAPVIDWLAIGPNTPRRIAATSLALFAATMEFSALHALTGMHWVRILMPFAPDPVVLQRQFWQVVASLVPKIGFPELPSAETLDNWRHLPCPEWPDIVRAAIASDDEHDISLVFSAREEEKIYPDRLYRVVAARRVRLID